METVKMVQSIPGWTDIESSYRLSRASYIYINVELLAWHFNDLSQVCESDFTWWAIIELSIRRRLRTFLTSWGQITHVKHCNVDLLSWYELWFVTIVGPPELSQTTWFSRGVSWIAQSLTMSAYSWQSERQNIKQNACLTAMFSHFIGG